MCIELRTIKFYLYELVRGKNAGTFFRVNNNSLAPLRLRKGCFVLPSV
jgi:hypothetical protein